MMDNPSLTAPRSVYPPFTQILHSFDPPPPQHNYPSSSSAEAIGVSDQDKDVVDEEFITPSAKLAQVLPLTLCVCEF